MADHPLGFGYSGQALVEHDYLPIWFHFALSSALLVMSGVLLGRNCEYSGGSAPRLPVFVPGAALEIEFLGTLGNFCR